MDLIISIIKLYIQRTFYIITLSIIITVCRLTTGEYKTSKKLFKGQRIRGDSKLRKETCNKARATLIMKGQILSECGRREVTFSEENLTTIFICDQPFE